MELSLFLIVQMYVSLLKKIDINRYFVNAIDSTFAKISILNFIW